MDLKCSSRETLANSVYRTIYSRSARRSVADRLHSRDDHSHSKAIPNVRLYLEGGHRGRDVKFLGQSLRMTSFLFLLQTKYSLRIMDGIVVDNIWDSAT